MSTPTTIIFCNLPVSINCDAVYNEYIRLEQAASTSNPQALVAPTSAAIRLAVAGKINSGVTVATIIKSMDFGSVFVFYNRSCVAFIPM